MDAVAALDALILVDLAESGFRVHRDGTDRAGFLAGTHEVNDCTVRAGSRAHAAFLALVRINMCPDAVAFPVERNRAEMAGIIAGMPQASVAVVGDRISCKRAVIACGRDDLDDILCVFLSGAEPSCHADSLADDFTFAIDAAAVLRMRSRNHFFRKKFLLFFEFAIPGKF